MAARQSRYGFESVIAPSRGERYRRSPLRRRQIFGELSLTYSSTLRVALPDHTQFTRRRGTSGMGEPLSHRIGAVCGSAHRHGDAAALFIHGFADHLGMAM